MSKLIYCKRDWLDPDESVTSSYLIEHYEDGDIELTLKDCYNSFYIDTPIVFKFIKYLKKQLELVENSLINDVPIDINYTRQPYRNADFTIETNIFVSSELIRNIYIKINHPVDCSVMWFFGTHESFSESKLSLEDGVKLRLDKVNRFMQFIDYIENVKK